MVCTEWMYPAAKSADVSQTVEFHILWPSGAWNSLTFAQHDTSLTMNAFTQRQKKLTFSDTPSGTAAAFLQFWHRSPANSRPTFGTSRHCV